MSTTSRGPSRRTLVKGAAWSVPVVAMAQPAMAVVCSPGSCPPPPSFDFLQAYKNPGNSCTSSCIPKQSYGVPVTVTNPSDEDFLIKFTSYSINGVAVGVHGVTSGIADCPAVATGCDTGTCGTSISNSACIPANSGPFTVYVTSGSYGSSPQGGQSIGWEWIRKSDCEVVLSNTATSLTSPPNDACSGPGGQSTNVAETEEELSDSSGLTEANDPPVEDTAKTESITPVKPSTDVEPSPDVTTTDESSTDTQP